MRVGLLVAAVVLLTTIQVQAGPASMTREQIICRAKSGLGFSYWWGQGAWCASGCSPNYNCGKGKCTPNAGSSGCPKCSHSGSTGADCSGYVARAWNVPYEKPISTNWHPYSTYHFYWNKTHWDHIDKSAAKKGDALTYRKLTSSGGDCSNSSSCNGGGHIVVYESGDPYGYSHVNHAKGCKPNILYENKYIDSKYRARRRHNLAEGVCTPGQSQSQACGSCGSQSRTCDGSGQWGGWSGCGGQGVCAKGASDTQACGNCGTKSRTCSNSCQWGGWSGCTGQGVCVSGAAESKACGNCGASDRACGANCQWTSWSECKNAGACAPGEQGIGSCGNCGTRLRSCDSNCGWDDWSGCEGEGECPADSAVVEACGDCGQRSRQCSPTCDWNEWSSCSGPDPLAGQAPCETGLAGFCAEGIQRCSEGWLTCVGLVQPAPELCDALDNDCDGQADNGAPEEFGETIPGLAAELVDFSFPQILVSGGRAAVWADFQNVGSEDWPKGSIWLRLVDSNEGTSPLYDAQSWSAWDVAAVLGEAVEPGETGRFAFEILGPEEQSGTVYTSLVLSVPGGASLMCPTPSLHLKVMLLPRDKPLGPGESIRESTLSGDVSEEDVPVFGRKRIPLTADEPGGAGCAAQEGNTAALPALVLLLAMLLFLRSRQTWMLLIPLVMISACGWVFDDGERAADPLDAMAEVVDAAPPPAGVESVTPATIDPRGGTLLLISGYGFKAGAIVRLDDLEVPTTYVSDTQLEVVAPPLLAGQYHVWIIQPGGYLPPLFCCLEVAALELSFVQAAELSFPSFLGGAATVSAAADFDSDGLIDLVVALDGELLFLAGDGKGNFSPDAPPLSTEEAPPRFDGQPYDPRDLAIADFDGNGTPDLFVSTGPDMPHRLLFNDGDAVFTEREGGLPIDMDDGWGLDLGDINEDGLPDVVIANGANDVLAAAQTRLYLSDTESPGSLANASEFVLPEEASAGRAVALFDADGDGDVDLAVGALESEDGQLVHLYISGVDGWQQAPMGAIPPIGDSVWDLLAVDLDGDQDKDLFVVTNGQDLLLRNDGSGFFFNDTTASLPVDMSAGRAAVAADLDLDGLPDLVVANMGQQNRLYRNDGGGGFLDLTPELPMEQDLTNSAGAFDVDGDGDRDLTFLNGAGMASRLLLSVQPGGAP
jgi:uncharacterized protein (TIGR03382 family)